MSMRKEWWRGGVGGKKLSVREFLFLGIYFFLKLKAMEL